MNILVVTGMSGAGKSTALDALEDLGMYCVDNLPLGLLADLVKTLSGHRPEPSLAVGVDARTVEGFETVAEVFRELRAGDHSLELLFLDADSNTLLRRFSETRRRHPTGELPAALAAEDSILLEVRDFSSSTIDTSNLTGRQLRHLIRERYGASSVLDVVLLSFGFKKGLPSQADLVFDGRFIANPYEQPGLRALSGLDKAVADFLGADPECQEFSSRVESLLRFQIPLSLREGRSYLTVAIGCTGGQHRSVFLVESLAKGLRKCWASMPVKLSVRHRDVELQHAR